MARPTKYNDKVVAQAKNYLNTWEEAGDMIPSVEGLALNLKLARQTLYNWGDEYPEFLDILEEINIVQKKTLINKGLSGAFNSNITKLVLGKHGFSEKQEISGTDGQPLIPDVIKVIYE
jgi:hypothetical protein